MDFRRANRGQALQVGAILLFGFLVIGLAAVQTTVVPQQNEGVEFNAYQEAAGDVADLRNGVLAAAERDASGGTTVKTGAAYPSRAFFVNPGPPATRLKTTETRNVTISNVSAVDGEATNAQRFVDATDDASGDGFVYRTRSLRFDPDYNEFDGQPMVVAGESAYRIGDGGVVPLAGQTLIQGNRINLVMLDGEVSAGGSEATVTTDPVSAGARTVTVTGEGDDPIVLELDSPPGVTAAEWVDSPVGRSVQANERVVAVDADGDRIRVELDPAERYRLQLSLVEVRERGAASTIEEPGAEYVVRTGDRNHASRGGQRVDLTVEIRNEYNNPVSGETVEFEAPEGGQFENDDGGLTDTINVTTNSDGRATVTWVAVKAEEDPLDPGTYAVNASIDSELEYGETDFRMQVFEDSALERVTLEDGDAVDGDGDGDRASAQFDVQNRGDEPIEITEVVIERTSKDETEFVYTTENGDTEFQTELHIDAADGIDGHYNAGGLGTGWEMGTPANLSDPGVDAEARTARIEGRSEALVTLHFFSGNTNGDGQPVPMGGSFVEVTIVYQVDGDREETTQTILLF